MLMGWELDLGIVPGPALKFVLEVVSLLPNFPFSPYTDMLPLGLCWESEGSQLEERNMILLNLYLDWESVLPSTIFMLLLCEWREGLGGIDPSDRPPSLLNKFGNWISAKIPLGFFRC